MKKLNTHTVYTLSLRIHPLTSLKHKDGMVLRDIFSTIVMAVSELTRQLGPEGYFSPSLKRSAGALLRTMYALGLPPGDIFNVDVTAAVGEFALYPVSQAAKEFETILSNELPGLATYVVSQKGIYSTDELISQAEMHVPDKYRSLLGPKATGDVQQGGRCLAFEVATASAFHMWRAVESVMNSYHVALIGKSFTDANVGRNWGNYIEALKAAQAETKITAFLDFIREEYRNPITHPDDTLELDEAFALFGAAMSAIGQILRAIYEINEAQKQAAAPATPTLTALRDIGAKAGAP